MNHLNKKIISSTTTTNTLHQKNEHIIDIKNTPPIHTNKKTLPTGQIYFGKDIPDQSFTFTQEHFNSEWENKKPLDGLHYTPINESIFIGIRINKTDFKYLSLDNFLEYTKKTTLTKEAPYGYNPWTREPLNDKTTFFVGEGEKENQFQFISFEYSKDTEPEYTPLLNSRPNSPDELPEDLRPPQLRLIRVRHRRRLQNQNTNHCKNLCIISTTTSTATVLAYTFLGIPGIYLGIAALGASVWITGTHRMR